MDALAGLRADRYALLTLGAGLSAEQWAQPSGCPGWTLQDVVAHLAGLFWLATDPGTLPDRGDLGTEAAQEIYVGARRSMTAAENLADYEKVSASALDLFASIAGIDTEIDLGDFGTYPANALPLGYTFDHYLHIRADLFGPRGALSQGAPPSDELRLGPALDWVDLALPQQARHALAELDGTVTVQVTGPGARTITLGLGPNLGSISADGDNLLRWVSGRSAWPVGSGISEPTAKALSRVHLF